ncbi:MAG: hypothetical protein ABJL67_20730, partial [Sulfitobacter sp.]
RFLRPARGVESIGGVQSFPPIPTPTLSSLLSECLLTHAVASLSSPQAVPITLYALAMLLVCCWNEVIGIGVENKTHLNYPASSKFHPPDRAGFLSTEAGARVTTARPS